MPQNTPRHATFSFETQEKKKNQTAQQIGDANCSHHSAKQHLWQQDAHSWNVVCPHAKTVACKTSASAVASASPTLLLWRVNVVRERGSPSDLAQQRSPTPQRKSVLPHTTAPALSRFFPNIMSRVRHGIINGRPAIFLILRPGRKRSEE